MSGIRPDFFRFGGSGAVAIFDGNQNGPNLQKRVEGAKEAFAKYPGVKLNRPGVFYHAETPEKAAEAVTVCPKRESRHSGLGSSRGGEKEFLGFIRSV